jgi:hypothetical protein
MLPPGEHVVKHTILAADCSQHGCTCKCPTQPQAGLLYCLLAIMLVCLHATHLLHAAAAW